MQHVRTDLPIGTVVVTAASLARYAEFWLAIESLEVPHGTRLVASRGADIPHQLNEGIRNMVGEWVWILGDDHSFRSSLLLKLLSRNVDVVMPVVPRREAPFAPCLMHKKTRYKWADIPTTGLFRLPKEDYNGQAGALIRKPVLDKLGDPWFEAGKLTPGRLMEDMYFIHRLHQLDIPIWIDCDEVMGHMASLDIVPRLHEGHWHPTMPSPAGPIILADTE